MMSYGASYEIYGNYQVLNPDGKLIFRCDQKKFDWYLRKGIAEKVDEKVIRLKFLPGGDGMAQSLSLIIERKNICVVCGATSVLNRHHVVPYCYRRYFPIEMKNHNHYDILPLCTRCHDRYEADYAIAKKYEIAARFDAPVHGSGVHQESFPKYRACRSAHAIRIHKDKIPAEKMKSLLENIQVYLERQPTDEDIVALSDIGLSRYCKGPFYKSHGEVVVSRLGDTNDFVREWRKHFIDCMNPQYLPDGWSVEGMPKESQVQNG